MFSLVTRFRVCKQLRSASTIRRRMLLTNANTHWQNDQTIYQRIKLLQPSFQHCYNHNSHINDIEFESICEETLDSLTEHFEEIVDKQTASDNVDILYSNGVLTANLGSNGTYVINKQSPNKQIWLSSPATGPKRFDFDSGHKRWVYRHTGQTLHALLQEEISKIITNAQVDFHKCSYGT